MKRSTSFNFLLSSVLFFVLIFTGNAQLQNANWYFGNQAGLNLNDGTAPPTALTNSGMNTVEGCASVSDNNGDLLFYTDGINIWKNNHQTVSGSSLYGSVSVSQSVIVVPVTGTGRNFYIFTNQGPESGSYGLSYSKLRMTQDDSDDPYFYSLSYENTQLLTISSEKLTSVYNPNDDTSWVVSFAPSSNLDRSDTFYVFKVDSNGVSLENQFTFSFLRDSPCHPGGQMKISPDGTKLAMVHNTVGEDIIYTFDFDMVSGTISSKEIYSLDNVLHCYGLEFSPDSDKLFVTATHQLSDGETMNDIYQIWYRNAEAFYMPVQYLGAGSTTTYSLQLALDGKIYAATNSDKLHCITNPNGVSQNVSIECNTIDLNGKTSIKGLPQFVSQLPNYTSSDRGIETKYTILENPFEEDLRIRFHITGQFDLQLRNLAGNIVIDKEITITSADQVKEIDAEDIADGIYVLTIIDQDHNNEEHSEMVLKIDD